MNNAEVLITFKGDSSSVEEASKNIGKSLDSVKTKGELALAGLTTAMDKFTLNFISGGINYNAQIETYLTRLTTLTGSAEKANEVLEQIKKDALKTPFDVSSLTQAESLLLSTGLSADDARADILALGDAVSASGGGNAELQRMAVNLQQIKNVGKASALDIKQFAYAGIDIYGLLADSMGITREEASKMDVTYEMLSTALKKASSEGGKYYGAMEKQSETYSGAMSNLKESLEVLKGEIAKDLFNAIKKIIPVLTKMFDWLGKNHKVVKAIAVPLLVFFNTIMLWVGIQKIIGIIQALNAVLLANPVMLVVAAILALIAVIVYLYNNCEWFRNMLKGFMSFIAGVVAFIISIPGKIINFFAKLPGRLLKIGKDMINGLKNGVVSIWNGFTTYIGEKIDWILSIFDLWDDMVKVGEDLINGIKKGVTNVWNGFTGFLKDRAQDIKDIMAGKGGVSSALKTKLNKAVQSSVNATANTNISKSASTHLNSNVNITVNNNMKTDPLGQVVNRVKTFSGGSKNDYNYGYGG